MSVTRISRFISLVLRHKPEEAGIKLDNHGWADVADLIHGVDKRYPGFDMSLLEYIVDTDNKQRYSFNSDKTKIRANQGHSIPVDLEFEEKIPPEILYHGTATKYLDSILNTGINKQTRQYVHLSDNIDTAIKVGKRHGNCVVLKIDTVSMIKNNYKFYQSENKVWLTDHVPVEYIEIYKF